MCIERTAVRAPRTNVGPWILRTEKEQQGLFGVKVQTNELHASDRFLFCRGKNPQAVIPKFVRPELIHICAEMCFSLAFNKSKKS